MRLAEIDPGGQYMNRPMESARRALWPPAPQTSAPLDRRMDALDGLLERFPNVGGALLRQPDPRPDSHWTESDRPRFRDWLPTGTPTNDDIQQAIRAIGSRVAAMETNTEPVLDPVSAKLEQLVERSGGRFGWDPVPDEVRPEIVRQRRRAVHELFDLGGTGAPASFAGRVQRPELEGAVVADRFGDSLTGALLPRLAGEGADRQLALGWTKRMAERRETAWAGRLLGDHPGLDVGARADVLLQLPPNREVWELVAREEHETVRQSYWLRIGELSVPEKDFGIYLDSLLEHDRLCHAIRALWTRTREAPDELIENGTVDRVLAIAARAGSGGFNDTDIYYVGQLMDLLHPDSDAVVNLEARFFLRLSSVGRSPAGIYIGGSGTIRPCSSIWCARFTGVREGGAERRRLA